MEFVFKQAKPVWGENLVNKWNQFLGFRTELNLPEKNVCILALLHVCFIVYILMVKC
jgi:hypothetical protein